MRIPKHLFVFFLCALFFCTNNVLAQTNKIEILKTSLENTSVPVQKLDAALTLCEQAHSLNADTLYRYANLANKMAVALGDRKKKILADTYIEIWLGRKNFFDSALKICNSDLKKITYINAGNVYAKVFMQKCFLLMKSNRHKEALDEAYHFLQEAETQEDTLSQIYCKYIIGSVYRNLQQTDLALQWFYKADHTAISDAYEEKKNEFGVYFLIGMMYNWKEDADIIKKDRGSDSLMSVFYLDKAIEYSRKYENMAILARSLCIKADGIEDPKQMTVAEGYLKEAIHIYDQMNDTLSILNGLTSMSNYYMSIGQPEKGIAACKQGIEMIKRGNAFPVVDFYWTLGQCYKAAGNYQKYSETLNTIINLKDTVYKKNSERDLADLNAKYEDQKKENTIIQQKLDIAAKKNTTYAVLILSGLLFISILFLYRYYYKRQKEQKQKEIIAIAAAEEAERRRISADLHDNIGAYAAAAASTIATINPKDAQSRNTLSLLKDNVQDMITQLNDSIWALNKKAVRLTGISDRFKVFIQKLEHAYPDIDILVNEDIERDRLLTPFQALHLFRIMQEALNNALRHSKCHAVSINIISNEKILQINIVDDGIGMYAANFNGNGINNLKTRAKESGWNAEWVNNKNAGTSVIISTEN
jgi:signal transduction histidine kinase